MYTCRPTRKLLACCVPLVPFCYDGGDDDERMHQFKNAFRNNLLYVNGIDFDLQTDR
jgi:hypothetical protein